jgi:hypothetical protein
MRGRTFSGAATLFRAGSLDAEWISVAATLIPVRAASRMGAHGTPYHSRFL